MVRERNRFQESFRGAWRGAGLSGLSCLSGFSGLFGSTNVSDQPAPHTPRARAISYKPYAIRSSLHPSPSHKALASSTE